MKLHTALLLGALIVIPGVALAQDATPPAPAATAAPAAPAGPMVRTMRFHMDPAVMKAHMAKMKAAMKQMEALRKAERAATLGDLSSAHRAYLASVVGNLAVAANPNPKAAIAAIDAKLTSGEKAAILATHKAYAAKSKALFVSLMKDMPHPPGGINPGGPMQPAHAMASPHGSSKHKMHHHTPTAGMLLFAQTGFGGRRGFGMMGPGMMGGHRMVFVRMRTDGPGGNVTWHGSMHGHGGPGPVVQPDMPVAPVTPVPAPTATP
jgi:hypothetical protein